MKKALSLVVGLALGALAVVALESAGTAQIERLSLRQMVSRTDNCVMGSIIGREVIRVDHPVDGPELYYTFLTIQGRSLLDNAPVTVDVAYAGGFIDKERGVYNSEAPSEDDTRVGNRIVAFYKWTDNMGGDVAANALYTAHGGLYRTYNFKGRIIIQGRGQGYAIESNIERAQLTDRMTEIK
jgi:hypothetical protein